MGGDTAGPATAAPSQGEDALLLWQVPDTAYELDAEGKRVLTLTQTVCPECSLVLCARCHVESRDHALPRGHHACLPRGHHACRVETKPACHVDTRSRASPYTEHAWPLRARCHVAWHEGLDCDAYQRIPSEMRAAEDVRRRCGRDGDEIASARRPCVM